MIKKAAGFFIFFFVMAFICLYLFLRMWPDDELAGSTFGIIGLIFIVQAAELLRAAVDALAAPEPASHAGQTSSPRRPDGWQYNEIEGRR